MRQRSRPLRGPYQLPALATTGLALFAGALAVWWYGDAAARYAWREWREPALALALDRGDAALMMEIGNAYYGVASIGDAPPRYSPAIARRAFTKALAIEPGILWGHYTLARIAFAEGDLETALRQINAELAAHPENLRALYVRGLIYGYRGLPGDLARSEADFIRFVEWAPSEWAGYNDLAWILAKEGKYEEMRQVVKRALLRTPAGNRNPWLLNALGTAELNVGAPAAAAAAYAEALAYAELLTPLEWRQAYSGSNPRGDAGGLEAFVAGIRENLARAERATGGL